jgi:hypothetical protein
VFVSGKSFQLSPMFARDKRSSLFSLIAFDEEKNVFFLIIETGLTANVKHPSDQFSVQRVSSKSGNEVLTPVSFINLAGNIISVKEPLMAQEGPTGRNRSLPVKIAPKPSPMHLTAAIALSQLAGDVGEERL